MKDLLSFPVKPLAWKTAATEGYPIPATLSFSSASWWSPPWAQMNLNGFPLNFKATSLMVLRYPDLSCGVESSLCGKNEIMHKPK